MVYIFIFPGTWLGLIVCIGLIVWLRLWGVALAPVLFPLSLLVSS